MNIGYFTAIPLLCLAIFASSSSTSNAQVHVSKTTAGSKCKVKDPDISSSYKGACAGGLAHGQGEAKGHDTYVGHFYEGEPNGIGTYTWGSSTKWAGDVYTGEWRNGARTGFGKYEYASGVISEGEFVNSILHGFGEVRYPRKETIGVKLSENGFWSNDTFILKGYWREGKFVLKCENLDDCARKWTDTEQKSKPEVSLLVCKGQSISSLAYFRGEHIIDIVLTKQDGKVVKVVITNQKDGLYELERRNSQREAGNKPIYHQLLIEPDAIILRTDVTQDNAVYFFVIKDTGDFEYTSIVRVTKGRCEVKSKVF